MTAAPKRRFVLANDNTVFYTGSRSRNYSLPADQTKDKWTELSLSKEANFDDKIIVDLACGNHYSFFVTSKGNLYALGGQFWEKYAQEVSDSKFEKVNVPEGWFVQRVWASWYKSEIICLVEVKTAAGIDYFSVGSSESGLLGQGSNDKGEKIKETKVFGLLSLPSKDIQFKQISIGQGFALAIDQSEQLWAWGSNTTYQTGIPTETQEGFYKPQKVPFVETLKLKVLKVAAGAKHSLVQTLDENGRKKMYSLGKDESIFRSLGVSKELSNELTYHEIIAFSELDIIDFSASRDHSMVIMAGEDKPTDNMYVHKLPGGEATGLIHFYKNEDDSWTFLSEQQYDAALAAGTLPDICFATKHPIKDIEKVVKTEGAFPDLKELAKEMVENDEEPCQKVVSSLTQQPIQGARYSSTVKINHDHINVNLPEKEIRGQITQFDLNPIIYVRFGRPLKEKAKLPMLDDGEDDVVEEFDYDKYNKLSLKDKIEQRPYRVEDEIELKLPTMKVPSHGCELRPRRMDERTGYRCNKINGASNCLSGLDSFY